MLKELNADFTRSVLFLNFSAKKIAMIDLNTIKEKYESMSDFELLNFAKEEGHHLTAEGLVLLKSTLDSRHLENNFINDQENTEVAGTADNLNKQEENILNDVQKNYWSYIFDEKEAGKSNEDIITGLKEMGVEGERAFILIPEIESRAKRLLKNADSEKLTGGFIFIGGIAVTFLPLQMTTNRLAFIIAWCAILFGAGRFIKGLYFKHKYKIILENIEAEKKL